MLNSALTWLSAHPTETAFWAGKIALGIVAVVSFLVGLLRRPNLTKGQFLIEILGAISAATWKDAPNTFKLPGLPQPEHKPPVIDSEAIIAASAKTLPAPPLPPILPVMLLCGLFALSACGVQGTALVARSMATVVNVVDASAQAAYRVRAEQVKAEARPAWAVMAKQDPALVIADWRKRMAPYDALQPAIESARAACLTAATAADAAAGKADKTLTVLKALGYALDATMGVFRAMDLAGARVPIEVSAITAQACVSLHLLMSGAGIAGEVPKSCSGALAGRPGAAPAPSPSGPPATTGPSTGTPALPDQPTAHHP